MNITQDMVFAVHEIEHDSCKGCIAKLDIFDGINACKILNHDGTCYEKKRIFILKREFKPHYRTAPANYRDSE